MIECPNCKTSLPFFKVGFLSRMKNRIQCKNCGVTLDANKSLLGITGGLSGGISGGLLGTMVIWNEEIISYNPSLFVVGTILVILSFLISAFIQNKHVKFSIVDLEKEKVEKEIKRQNKIDYVRVENLKKIYSDKSDKELIEISNDTGMTEEANIAAKELLKNKNIT